MRGSLRGSLREGALLTGAFTSALALILALGSPLIRRPKARTIRTPKPTDLTVATGAMLVVIGALSSTFGAGFAG